MKYIKNKIFLVSLTLALCFVMIFSVFYVMGIQNLPASMIQAAMKPFQTMFTNISEALDGYAIYFSNVKELYEENRALQERVDQLENQLNDAQLAVNENSALREYLGIRDRYEALYAVGAQVLGKSDGTYLQYITLNKGSSSGIKENMPVITQNGLVGYVCDVSINSCRVSTILQYDTGVGVYVQRTGDVGLSDCPYAMGEQGLLRVIYLPENAKLQIGDRIVTGDLGDIYPSGLTVGHVVEIMPDLYNRTLTATIKPAVDFETLDQVYVVTGFAEKQTNAATEAVEP